MFGAIESHIKNFESQLYTACPAKVEKYDPEECTVDVTPTIYKADKDGVLIKELTLDRVPLHFQAAKDIGMTFPVSRGDTVLLIFSHSDTENWLTTNSEFTKPQTYRKHSLNDAFAIAGVFKYSKSPVVSGTEDDVNIYYKDSYIRLKQNQDLEIHSPTKITLDTPETIVTGNITVQGDTTLSNNVTSNGKDISDTHTHGGVSSGGSSTDVPD